MSYGGRDKKAWVKKHTVPVTVLFFVTILNESFKLTTRWYPYRYIIVHRLIC